MSALNDPGGDEANCPRTSFEPAEEKESDAPNTQRARCAEARSVRSVRSANVHGVLHDVAKTELASWKVNNWPTPTRCVEFLPVRSVAPRFHRRGGAADVRLGPGEDAGLSQAGASREPEPRAEGFDKQKGVFQGIDDLWCKMKGPILLRSPWDSVCRSHS